MIKKSDVLSSSMKLWNWIKRENYSGYDPYDGLSGKMSLFSDKKLLNLLLLQMNLYSPVNLRPMLGIKKGRSNKCLALLARANLILYEVTKRSEFRNEAELLLDNLINANLSKTQGEFSCSSYYFKYVAPRHLLDPTVPDIVCLTESIKSFIKAFQTLKNELYLEKAEEALGFLTSNLLAADNGVYHFKYTPRERGKIVINVSALALEAISRYLDVVYRKDLYELGVNVAKLILKYQRKDGAWPYSVYSGGHLYWQIDYHQGFIIDGLASFKKYYDAFEIKYAINNGVEFYKKLFIDGCKSYYRYPIKYPIDIHNQAQGIITFSKLFLENYSASYIDMSKEIAHWTIKNMQNPIGYFYHQRWPLFVNTIPYIRWGQAWMLLALSVLLKAICKN